MPLPAQLGDEQGGVWCSSRAEGRSVLGVLVQGGQRGSQDIPSPAGAGELLGAEGEHTEVEFEAEMLQPKEELVSDSLDFTQTQGW